MKLSILKNKLDNNLIYILSILWFLYSVVFSTYNYKLGVMFLGVYATLFVLVNNNNRFLIILYSLPFAAIFKISSSTPSMLIALYVLYIIISILDIKFKIRIIDIILIILLIITQILTFIIYESSVVSVISFILNIVFLKIVILNFNNIEMKEKQNLLKKSAIYYSISMSISIIIADIFPNIPYIILPQKQAILMSINRFSGINGDPNYYSQLLLIAIGLLAGAIKYEKLKIKKYAEILIILFLVINGFRSISKSYAIAIVILILITYFYIYTDLLKKSNSSMKIIVTFISVLIGIITMYFIIFKVSLPLIESRSDSTSLLTGRDVIWKAYYEAIKSNPLIIVFGAGFGNGGALIVDIYGHADAAHNVYMELITDIGIVGILILVILFKEIFFNIKKIFKDIYSLYLTSFIITSVGLSLSSNDAIYIVLPISILIIDNKITSKYKIK